MFGLGEIVKKAREGKLGFRMDEVMSGDHAFEADCGDSTARRPMQFKVTWGPESISEWIDPRSDKFLWQELEGSVSVDGLCDETPCKGTLELKYLDGQFLRYDFRFDVEGKPYRFVGEKVNIWPWNLPVSHTTCYGVLTEADTGKLISKSVTHFRFRTIPAFLASMRFW